MKNFEDVLQELRIPDEHSIFEIASGKTGYNLMTRKEVVKHALEGKGISWFVEEFRKRYYAKIEVKYR